MKIIQTLPLILILFAGSGCIILPIPLPSEQEEIDKVQGQLVVGSTTREEVISVLGEPDVTKERYILYIKKKYYGGMPFISYPSGGVVGKEFMDLYFEFDNYGTLIEYRSDKYGQFGNPIKDDENIPKAKVEEDCDPGMESCD